MFNNILGFWKGKDFMPSVLEDFGLMIEKAEEMFLLAKANILGEPLPSDADKKIYAIDKGCNISIATSIKGTLDPWLLAHKGSISADAGYSDMKIPDINNYNIPNTKK